MPRAYAIVTRDSAGREHVRHYTSDGELGPGSVVALDDRRWLIQSIDGERAQARPGRYRLTLRHPNGAEEAGAIRRLREDAPTLGHQLTTLAGGAAVSWSVVEQRLAEDAVGEPLLELIAERDYDEADGLPDHQLEHVAASASDADSPAAALVARAESRGLSIELVSLEEGHAADWDEAVRFVESLILEEIGEDLLALCGVNVENDSKEHWLERVQQRLRDDLDAFRSDVERAHDQIEQWDFRGGRIFAAVGSTDDEANPLGGYGWMCRLVDSDTLGAAGFRRVRKASLAP